MLIFLFCNSLKIRMFATNPNYQVHYVFESCVSGTAVETYTSINNTFHFSFQIVKWFLITGDFHENNIKIILYKCFIYPGLLLSLLS